MILDAALRQNVCNKMKLFVLASNWKTDDQSIKPYLASPVWNITCRQLSTQWHLVTILLCLQCWNSLQLLLSRQVYSSNVLWLKPQTTDFDSTVHVYPLLSMKLVNVRLKQSIQKSRTSVSLITNLIIHLDSMEKATTIEVKELEKHNNNQTTNRDNEPSISTGLFLHCCEQTDKALNPQTGTFACSGCSGKV